MRPSKAAPRFDEVIRANEDDLLRYFERRMLNPADAADAFSELLLTAWRNRRKMPHDDVYARMWLFVTARHVLSNARRSLSRRSAAVQHFIEEARAESQTGTHDSVSEVREAIDALQPADAELIRLVYWDGFKTDEAAAILKLNPSTARSRLSRIKRDLKTTLDNSSTPEPPEGNTRDTLRH